MDALKDGAFDFLLTLSADVKSVEWHDPARHGLRQWLQRKAPALLPDSISFSDDFQAVLMDHLENFVETFISNLPDILRRLRQDEDEQRQLSQTHEHDLDLERFLVIISFAFEGRPDAALGFWSDQDSNLNGFLHWASQRASTPRISAFCEMLQAISEDEECAASAHEFLLGDTTSSTSKLRRNLSLSWNHMFSELRFFSSKIRDRPALPQSSTYRNGKPNTDQAETEPESAMMLESFLRLISRLCRESGAVRSFLLLHQTFHITELLYQFASSAIPSRLRACAFATLEALISHKTVEIGEFMWSSLDAWVSGAYSTSNNIARTTAPASTSWAMDGIFAEIGIGFEQPIAFVQLLCALIAPYDDEPGLNDALPFPELLGSGSRMPGIDPYIDFAVGQVFGTKAAELTDPIQLRRLRLACVQFIATCLSTFNENLVVFANQSNISVDSAIRTSDLATYMRLHPFTRVMEWLFNDSIMTALFATIHQDAAEVGNASPTSPLVLSIVCSIEVMNTVLDLQATYLDIVKPLMKQQSQSRRSPVSNAAFSSFEDGLLNHLSVLADLGLYCGAGHPALTVASLKLLGKLATSTKLSSPASLGWDGQPERNKAIAALEADSNAESISRSIVSELRSNDKGIWSSDSTTTVMKTEILSFIRDGLLALPNRPTLAHLLLGFQCGPTDIDVPSDGPFADASSLFHSIVDLVLELPIGNSDTGALSWLVSLRFLGLQILQQLWKSTQSSLFVMTELRSTDFMFAMFMKEPVIDSNTLWDGRSISDDDFLGSSSAQCLTGFLDHRAVLLQYIATEIRLVSREQVHTFRSRIVGCLLGSTSMPDGSQLSNSTIFDFLDFMELDLYKETGVPNLQFCAGIEIDVCLKSSTMSPLLYDMVKVDELLMLKQNELRNTGKIAGPGDVEAFETEAHMLHDYLVIANQLRQITYSRLSVTKAWAQLMLVLIKSGELKGSMKSTFMLQTLETILPKLDTYSSSDYNVTMALAKLAKSLLYNADFVAEAFKKGDTGDLASERLFQLFKSCLKAICSPIADAPLKALLYSICYRYVTGMADVHKASGILKRHSTQTIKMCGSRLLDAICDDAYAGEATCRISALLLLGAFVKMGWEDNSEHIIQSFAQLNFVGIIVHSLRSVATELQESKKQGMSFFNPNPNAILSYYRCPTIAGMLQRKASIAPARVSNTIGSKRRPEYGAFPLSQNFWPVLGRSRLRHW